MVFAFGAGTLKVESKEGPMKIIWKTFKGKEKEYNYFWQLLADHEAFIQYIY